MLSSSFWGPAALIFIAALGYSVTTAGMKLGSIAITPSAIALLVIGFTAATVAEIVILRDHDLGLIYILVIATETLLVLTLAGLIGEGLSGRQIIGAVIIGLGLVMATV